MCLPKKVNIKVVLGVSTSFLKHLKRSHDNTDALEEYNKYKKEEKEKKGVVEKGKEDNLKRTAKQQKLPTAFTKPKCLLDQDNFDTRILNFIVTTMSAVSVIDNPVALFEGMEVNVMSRNTAMKRVEVQFTKTMFKSRNI